jgi:hypothetical protein
MNRLLLTVKPNYEAISGAVLFHPFLLFYFYQYFFLPKEIWSQLQLKTLYGVMLLLFAY